LKGTPSWALSPCALYVARVARGQGIGTALLNDAKQVRQSFKLWTFQLNLQAQKLYLREGFKEVSRTDGTRNEESLPDIKYLWTA
jgi:GNAT superfamily N-acetyltransferase